MTRRSVDVSLFCFISAADLIEEIYFAWNKFTDLIKTAWWLSLQQHFCMNSIVCNWFWILFRENKSAGNFIKLKINTSPNHPGLVDSKLCVMQSNWLNSNSNLRHLGRDKMVTSLQRIFFKLIMIDAMAWHRTGARPLYEPLLTQFVDAYMRRSASIK